ncbi:triokinase/FMN cyclase isoform X3 [Hydra vulgaris]|uniref:Triokinase/FMN cyclase n=1 Tax=Hydra vulgaris TaxID=6087 RepID=A0ABM4CGQ8_HYDVU
MQYDSVDYGIGKKLVNDPLTCVADSLEGFVLSNAGVKLLKGTHIVVREDLNIFKKQKKVSLIAGGGSGHEPAHIGYIGKGMLTAAVCGDVFASPSSLSILSAIRACTNDAGVLLIVKNYTGDRLHFGRAVELAKSEGINVEMIVVGEDCAILSEDKNAGRRGLCGTILIHKIAGAMAEEGKTIDEIHKFLQESILEMGTISVSLSSCSIPGKPCNFVVGKDVVEFGLGIHGEPGAAQIKLESTHNLVRKMIDHMKSKYLELTQGTCVILIVNNLGALSNLELSIVAKETFNYLESLKVSIIRSYVGSFVTSLDMVGVSLTIMISNPERLNYLDLTTNAAAWPKSGFVNTDIEMDHCMQFDKAIKIYEPSGIGLKITQCCVAACKTLQANAELLNELDRHGGDGDTGTTFAQGASAILRKISSEKIILIPVNSPKDFFAAIAIELDNHMGGSSGALLSLLMTGISCGLKETYQLVDFISAFKNGIELMKKYGGAEEGDRTMLDALCPAWHALNILALSDITVKAAMKQAAEASRTGSNNTIEMNAKSGRASYVAKTRLAHPDPGAVAVALVFEAIEKSL